MSNRRDETMALLVGAAIGWLLLFAIARAYIPDECETCGHPMAGAWNCEKEKP